MTDYMTMTADSPPTRSTAIKLYDESGFAGMRKAGRLAAEILDALVPHVVPGVTTGELDDIVRRMRDPALLEYVGRGLIQASVFPIPPGEDRRIDEHAVGPVAALPRVEHGLLLRAAALLVEVAATAGGGRRQRPDGEERAQALPDPRADGQRPERGAQVVLLGLAPGRDLRVFAVLEPAVGVGHKGAVARLD